MDKYVLSVYDDGSHPTAQRPPLGTRIGTVRPKVVIAPEAIWNRMELANETNASLEAVIDIKADELSHCCCRKTATTWVN